MRTAPDGYPKLVVNARVRLKPDEENAIEPVGTIIEVGYCSVKIEWTDGHPVSLVCGLRMTALEVV